MTEETAKKQCEAFLQSKKTAVISTVAPTGQPMSAIIYYTVDDNFTFYFMTKTFSRKFKNLEKNQEVSLVVGSEDEPATAQIQGKAVQIVDTNEYNIVRDKLEKHFAGNTFVAPLFQLSAENHDIVLFKIYPTWIRWLDLRENAEKGSFVQIR